MSECPKCGNKLLHITSYVTDWEANLEPYESYKYEEHGGICEDAYFSAEYCEKCEQFLWIEIDADFLNKSKIETRNKK